MRFKGNYTNRKSGFFNIYIEIRLLHPKGGAYCGHDMPELRYCKYCGKSLDDFSKCKKQNGKLESYT